MPATPDLDDELSGFQRCGYPQPLRRYQSLALDAFDAARTGGADRAYLVMPPGSGKTVLGLEVARRLARRTLVLTPNTAVQAQWLAAWHQFVPADDHELGASSGRELDAPITVLTYQTLAVLDGDADEDPDPVPDGGGGGSAVAGVSAKQLRTAAVRSGDTATLLALLHPNGRALIERARGRGPWTLVLDECHHLLETWGALVVALTDALGPDTFVVGLTATPPTELPARQAKVQSELFGPATFSVPTPAVVKEGDLAPYQELVYLTEPTTEEQAWVSDQAVRFADLQVELADANLGSMPLFGWLERRLIDRRVTDEAQASPARLAGQGADSANQLSWAAFEASYPELARAGLRFAANGLLPLPEGARLREEHRRTPDAEDWVVVLEDFCVHHLVASSNPADQHALAGIRAVLPSLGFRLTTNGVRATTSPVDRLCALSASKAGGAVHLLATEAASRGVDLRALVLCDFEMATAELPASLRDSGLPPAAGSARLLLVALAGATVPDLNTGVATAGALKPVLVTGRTIAAAPELAEVLARFCEDRARQQGILVQLSCEPLAEQPQLTRLTSAAGAWTARIWTPLVTEFFTLGHARVLIGTRALLGEGWDAPCVNVSVDLTSAATATSITQMRGRSLRRDPERCAKVASNWSVACVADGHPRGDADYARLVRKHASYLAPAGRDGRVSSEIESGVTHCDDRLSPYAPPAADIRAVVTADALNRAADLAAVMTAWDIGGPYAGVEVATLRVRTSRGFGLADVSSLAGTTGTATQELALSHSGGTAGQLEPTAGFPTGSVLAVTPHRALGIVPRIGAAGALVCGPGLVTALAAGSTPLGIGVGAGVAIAASLAGGVRLNAASVRLTEQRPTAAVDQLAAAVADALKETGGTRMGAEAVQTSTDEFGWLRLSLAGVTRPESELFADSLDELLGPLAEPRYLIGRLVLRPPITRRAAWALALRRMTGRRIDVGVAYHGLPTYLGANKHRADAFTRAWALHVGPATPELIAASSPAGQAILSLFRGADPFAVTSQLRTLWT